MDDLNQIKAMLENQSRWLDGMNQARLRHLYGRMESLMALYHFLKPVAPLPSMVRYTSPELGQIIVNEFLAREPRTVFELGSGVTTLICAYCFERLGQQEGRIISIDHESVYLKTTRKHLDRHALAHYAELHTAPLAPIELNGTQWNWYDLSKVSIDETIDLLIVDGPPGHVQQNARFPALPVLHKKLSKNAVVIVDDAHRVQEQDNIAAWMDEFPEFTKEVFDTEKGVTVLRR